MSEFDPATADALLKELWFLQLKAMIAKLKEGSEKITAAELTAARQTLSDNGVSRLSLRNSADALKEAQQLIDGLPAFGDDGTPFYDAR